MNEKKYQRGNNNKSNTVIKFVPMHKKTIPIFGKKFGLLTVIDYLGINCQRSSVWQCKCDCGTICNANSVDLKQQKKISCGCITKKRMLKYNTPEPRKDLNTVGLNSIYKTYRFNAKNRNLSFNLNKEEFESIIKSKCHYCGANETNTLNLKYQTYKYTGVDRIDNTKGYESDNVLPCCKICNRMKSDLGLFEFIDYIWRLLQHSKNWIRPASVHEKSSKS